MKPLVVFRTADYIAMRDTPYDEMELVACIGRMSLNRELFRVKAKGTRP